MPFDVDPLNNNLAAVGVVSPAFGSYKLKTGQSQVFQATAKAGYAFDHWKLSDYETSQWQPPAGTTYYDWVKSGNDRKKITSNPITITVGGVDENKLNETYRTWWLNAAFRKL